jgi:hypothetical protein
LEIHIYFENGSFFFQNRTEHNFYWFEIHICLYLFQCEEYDIVEVIVRGVNEMYNRRNELIDKYFFMISVKVLKGYFCILFKKIMDFFSSVKT